VCAVPNLFKLNNNTQQPLPNLPHTQNIYFGCGKKATLNNLLYEVTGVVIKKNKDNYFWTEYALYNKTAGWLI
jgi:hypothetical protein